MKEVVNQSRKRHFGESLKDNLKILGVHYKRKEDRFYTAQEYWDLLEKAAAQYVHWRRKFHPDNGGKAEDFYHLHKAWLRVKSLMARRGFVLDREIINRDALVAGRPFEIVEKVKYTPFVPKSVKQQCLKHARTVYTECGGNYTQTTNALALRRILMELGIVFPDPSVDSEAHARVIKVMHFFGHTHGIKKQLRESERLSSV